MMIKQALARMFERKGDPSRVLLGLPEKAGSDGTPAPGGQPSRG